MNLLTWALLTISLLPLLLALYGFIREGIIETIKESRG